MGEEGDGDGRDKNVLEIKKKLILLSVYNEKAYYVEIEDQVCEECECEYKKRAIIFFEHLLCTITILSLRSSFKFINRKYVILTSSSKLSHLLHEFCLYYPSWTIVVRYIFSGVFGRFQKLGFSR